MSSALAAASLTACLETVRAALPGASPVDIDHALLVAIGRRQNDIFDLLLPLATPGADDFRAFKLAASGRNVHALGRLPPCDDDGVLAEVLGAALLQGYEDAAMAIIARLTPGQIVHSALYRAALRCSSEVVAALVPHAEPADCMRAFLLAAKHGVADKMSAVRPRVDVVAAIEHLISINRAAPADTLLPFLPPEAGLAVLERFSALKQHPNGAALLHAAHLEAVIARPNSAPAPRM